MKKKTLYYSGGVILIVLLVLSTWFTSSTNKTPETISKGDIVIDKSEITKTATFIPFESNGTYMELIAVQANDGTVRTALNTCQVCYNSGRGYYEQLGDLLICNNCGNQFTIDQIELIKGGCNPVPILSEMKFEDEELITISLDALTQFEPLFKNWRK